MGIFMVFFVIIRTSVASYQHTTFLTECAHFFSFKTPVYVSSDKEEAFKNLADTYIGKPTTLLTYIPYNEEREVARHLLDLNKMDLLDAVLFINEGHQILLELLATKLHQFSNVTGIAPQSDFPATRANLRFDTKIYLYDYEEQEERINLKELYAVNGKTISNYVGTWNEADGLSVVQPNMWERRNNLFGISLRVTTISTVQGGFRSGHNSVN